MSKPRLSLLVVLAAALALPGSAFASECPNEQLRVENNSTQLPECRAYELVTPGNHNAQGNTLGLTGQAVAPSGTTALVESITELPGSPVGGQGQDVARRSPQGWVMTPLEPANDEPDNVHSTALGAAGEDFSTVFLGDDNDLVAGDSDANIDDVFAVSAEGSLAWISQGPGGGVGTAPASSGGGNLESSDIVGGATASLSHVVFQTPFGKLVSQDTHAYGAEIYDRVNETATELVGVLPNKTVPVCGASLGGQQPSGGVGYYNSVSQAGTTVFFESPDPVSETTSTERPGLAACPAGNYTPPQLYVRLNDHETVQASAAAAGVADSHGEQEARYVAAAPEGTDVLFTSKGALTANANTGGDTTEDLYEYEVGTHSLTDVSSEGLTDPHGSLVQGVLGVSEGGSVVYFVAQGKLTSNATDGQDNLYVSDAGQLTYVAALNASDRADWEGVLQSRGARVTPDGSHLLFSSTASLTGYSNAGKAELYLYGLGSPTLTCVSCGAAGTTAGGAATLGGQEDRAFAPSTNMTPDASTVFFNSKDALTPGTTVGVGGVYEWHEGAVSLIAPGGPTGAAFVGASSDGSNVFLKTNESLVPEDENGGEADIYDARVNGGFPAPPKKEPGCSSNETCRNAGTSLSALTPASLTPTGTGNILPPPPPPKTPTTITKSKPLTNAQKLAAALKACKQDKAKKRRQSCEASAHKKYAPKPKPKKKQP